jgi:hypothetical protein
MFGSMLEPPWSQGQQSLKWGQLWRERSSPAQLSLVQQFHSGLAPEPHRE